MIRKLSVAKENVKWGVFVKPPFEEREVSSWFNSEADAEKHAEEVRTEHPKWDVFVMSERDFEKLANLFSENINY